MLPKNTSIILRFFVFAFCFLASGTLWAKPLASIERYRVRKGDTLELLAAEYYGNRVHKIYLMVENNWEHDRPLVVGERIRIPMSTRVTTASGDTLQGLAELHLGSPKRAKYLAEFNNLKQNDVLALGQELVIPLRVHYHVKDNENLRDIALSLFANAKRTTLLREYNDLQSDTLKAGQILSIPVPKVRLQASKRRPRSRNANARAKKRKEMMRKAAVAIPRAKAAWRNGDFAQVKHELTPLQFDYIDAKFAIPGSLMLGSVYLAYNDTDSAIAIFSKLQERHPKLTLTPKRHSPKVRKAWSKALQQRGER